MVPGILEKPGRIIGPYDRHPLRGPCPQKSESKRHFTIKSQHHRRIPIACRRSPSNLDRNLAQATNAAPTFFIMLTTLRIKNLGLVDDLTLELSEGYTTLTGETGAGKSMIIGALNLILGQRADRQLIRSGADLCHVEAVFDITSLRAPLHQFLEENGLEPCEGGALHLKRTIATSAANRQFINHSPAALGLLTELGRWLVDIHGPYDHQSLLDPRAQLRVLDAFGGITQERLAHAEIVNAIRSLERDKTEFVTDEQSIAQQADLLRFQAQEIANARLDQLNEEELEEQCRTAQNAAQIQTLCQELLGALSGSEPNLVEMIARTGQGLHQLSQLDPQTAPWLENHLQISEWAGDLESELSRYQDQVEIDPSKAIQLEEQLNQLQSLKRKYGHSIPKILQFGQEAEKKLHALEAGDEEMRRIDALIQSHLTQLGQQAKTLSDRRQEKAALLSQAVAKQLEDLGFDGGGFEVQIQNRGTSYENTETLHPLGNDHVEFLFGPNPGEPLCPLRKIASSGEIARVMLAVKTVLAAEDDVPLLVFDEVDANVGGETAHAVGEKMQRLGGSHQVICITHLAQVAAAADHHLQVSKQREKDRTLTQVTSLKKPERVEELARMLGGRVAAARKHAEALLKPSRPLFPEAQP